jgi:hypothetical protein
MAATQQKLGTQHTTVLTLTTLVTRCLPLHSEIGTTSYLHVKCDIITTTTTNILYFFP